MSSNSEHVAILHEWSGRMLVLLIFNEYAVSNAQERDASNYILYIRQVEYTHCILFQSYSSIGCTKITEANLSAFVCLQAVS